MLCRDHEHEDEREQTQDLADRKTSGESVRETYGSHIGRGFPRRTNARLRARRRRLTRGARHGSALGAVTITACAELDGA